MLMQQVLGTDWQKLPTVIQQHYAISDQQSSELTGTMTIDYPRFLFPLIWLIHLFGGLILWRGTTTTIVRKTAQQNKLYWQRFSQYADGSSDYFNSCMTFNAEHEVLETTSFGFGLRLRIEVKNGDLCYRSQGHFWQWRQFKLFFPDWLMLGTATISEHAISEHEFYLDFRIQHPLWGESYRYQGYFHIN